MKQLREAVYAALDGVVVGQREAVDGILIALGSRGHVLLEGPPGVAKTLVAAALARALGLEFSRAQCTPDMLPSDLTGTMTLRGGALEFRPGPVFTGFLLADEINRTPPKTQAALLEAMQEGQVSIEGEPRRLPDPFLVVATQNPIEYEGTYPLPEAQLDRFLLRVRVGYPDAEDERRILALRHSGVRSSNLETIAPALGAEAILAAQRAVDETTASPELIDYVAALVRATRDRPGVELGASPRAGVHLLVAAKTLARIDGRDYVTPDDVIDVAPRVLAHRILLSADAELEGASPVRAVEAVVSSVAVPR